MEPTQIEATAAGFHVRLCACTSTESTHEKAERKPCAASRRELALTLSCTGCQQWHCAECHSAFKKAIIERNERNEPRGLVMHHHEVFAALIGVADWYAVAGGIEPQPAQAGVLQWRPGKDGGCAAWVDQCPWCVTCVIPQPVCPLPDAYRDALPREILPPQTFQLSPFTVHPEKSTISRMPAVVTVRTFQKVDGSEEYGPQSRAFPIKPATHGDIWALQVGSACVLYPCHLCPYINPYHLYSYNVSLPLCACVRRPVRLHRPTYTRGGWFGRLPSRVPRRICSPLVLHKALTQ